MDKPGFYCYCGCVSTDIQNVLCVILARDRTAIWIREFVTPEAMQGLLVDEDNEDGILSAEESEKAVEELSHGRGYFTTAFRGPTEDGYRDFAFKRFDRT